MSEAPFDVLVVGAGPAGSTAARLLAADGWTVALVEKAEFPRRKVCGEFISATSLALLNAPGVGEAFFAMAGPPIQRVALFSGDTEVSASMPRSSGSADPWGRALGREHLDLILRDAAVSAGAQLYQPFSLKHIERRDGLFQATITSKAAAQVLSARTVISANGSWGMGPLAPPPRPHRAGDLLAFKAHFEDSALAKDLMPLLMFPGGYGGMAPTDSGQVSLSCCIRRDVLAQARAAYPASSAGHAVLSHIQQHCVGVRQALRDARLHGPILAAGPIRPGVRVRNRDSIFRVGNAAGEAHPIIAEGISMAMQSSWLLCRRLIELGRDATSASALQRVGDLYAKDWMGQFAPRIWAAQALATLAMRPSPTRAVTAVVAHEPALLTWGARISGKTLLLPS